MTLLEDLAGALRARLGDAVTRHASVRELTTYRVGGPLAVLVRARDEASLHAVAEALETHPCPTLVIGRGSNLLVAERGFEGLGIVLEGELERVSIDRDAARVRAGAAVPLPALARQCAAAGVTGLEFFVGIPGSVGGAVRMNAGGHGRETHEVLSSARVLDLADGSSAQAVELGVESLDLSYRHSNITDATVVLAAELVGAADAAAACEQRIAEIVRWRREHQPGGSNAGSVFRNPPGDSAGRLIDAAGLKGLRVGGAVVSPKHANFFQAEPGASADDVAQLVALVRERVADATGITLQPELRMVGFDERDAQLLDAEAER